MSKWVQPVVKAPHCPEVMVNMIHDQSVSIVIHASRIVHWQGIGHFVHKEHYGDIEVLQLLDQLGLS